MDAFWKAQLFLFNLLCIAPCFAIDIVRLVDSDGTDSTKSAEGIVEFYFDGKWGGICFNDFMKAEGGVVCRHLNFMGIANFSFHPSLKYKQHQEVEFTCFGHEENLHNCHHPRVYKMGGYVCNTSTLYISCYNQTKSSTAPHELRLGVGNRAYGELKFFSNGTWICGEDWGKLEGGVVCREMGFRGVESVTPKKKSTVMSKKKYKCNGYELSLAQCQIYNELDSVSYSSSEDDDENGFYDDVHLFSCSESVNVKCLRHMEFISPNAKRTYESKVGGNLALSCNATNSTEVWWKLQNYENKLGRRVGNNTEGVLLLQNISLEHQGSYICVAKGHQGQVVESEVKQTLIISDYAQLLLQTTTEAFNDNSITALRNISREKFKQSGYDVFIKDIEDSDFTIYLTKQLASDTSYTTISKEIDDIICDLKNTTTSKMMPFRKHGLSFCIEESVVTDAGIVKFTSTKINSKAESIQSCVTSKTPRATCKCLGDLLSVAVWEDAELRNCFNETDNSTANTLELVESFFEIAERNNVTSESVSFISRDLADISAMEAVTEEVIDNVTFVLDQVTNVKDPSPTVTRNVIEIVDNVVIQSSRNNKILTSDASSTIIKSFEQQLDTVKESGSNFSHTSNNIVVEVVQITDIDSPISFEFFQNDTDSETKLNRNDSNPQQEKDLQVSVQLPSTVLLYLSENCTLLSNASKSSLPVSFTTYLSGALFNDSRTENERDSLVVSTSMLCDVSSLPHGTFFSTLFSPVQNKAGEHPWECVFWKQSIDGDVNGNGGWSSEGCVDCGDKSSKKAVDTMSDTAKTIYSCSWTHLTSFAVLLDVKGDIDSKLLDVITIVGCVISTVSLLITIISHLFIKKLRSSQAKQIILMLCTTLCGLYCCFLIGIDNTKHKTLCVIFGGLIHFFCLSSVAWMSIEATHLYLLLVKVINAHVRYFVLKASIIAWGIPFVVVAVCIAVAWDVYAHNYCFPKHSSYVFYIGVLSLIALLLAYNILVYIMVIRSISATRKNITTSQTNRAGVMGRLQNALVISVLLGLSWLFGFFAIGSGRLTFNFLFCLFNSFQGFFIFLLFCLRQDEVREAWRHWFGIAICLKTKKDVGTETGETITSTGKQLTSEREIVGKSRSKATEKSEKIELLHSKSIKSVS